MTEDDLNRLLSKPLIGAVDRLEAAIWRRVDARGAIDMALATAGRIQALILMVAIAGALAWGASTAGARTQADALDVFSPHTGLAPSSLLIGADG